MRRTRAKHIAEGRNFLVGGRIVKVAEISEIRSEGDAGWKAIKFRSVGPGPLLDGTIYLEQDTMLEMLPKK